MERGIGYRENANVYVEKIRMIYIYMNVPGTQHVFHKELPLFFLVVIVKRR